MPPCILCGSDAPELFATRDRKRPADATIYPVHWCRACALGQAHIPDISPGHFFDVPYYTHGDAPGSSQPRSLLPRIAWRIDRGTDLSAAEVTGRTFCDIGCGDGTHLLRFRLAGFLTTGVEPDPQARKRAGEFFGSVFDGTAEELPSEVASECYDVVLMSHVLDACRDPRRALSNAAAILHQQGTLVIEVPNCASLGFRAKGPDWPWVDVPRHLHFFTEQSLKMILADAGFQIKSAQYLGYARQFRLGAGWSWFLRTACTTTERKYDSLRIHATRL